MTKKVTSNEKTKVESRKQYATDQQVFAICAKSYKKYKKAFDILKDK